MPTAEMMRTGEDLDFQGAQHPSGNLDDEMAQLLEAAGDRRLMAGTSTCTSTCSCTASHYSTRPCCC